VNRPAANVLRLAGRLVLTALVACIVVLMALQFRLIVLKNVAMAGELEAKRAEISALERREAVQTLTLRRLASPEGAVPEIHAKLQLVGPHEEIIYVRPPADPSESGK
jgi:hypothetical protein